MIWPDGLAKSVADAAVARATTPGLLEQLWDGEGCDHAGEHCEPLKCPECGRYSGHSWSTSGESTENGWNQYWGGTCRTHGEWSDAAA